MIGNSPGMPRVRRRSQDKGTEGAAPELPAICPPGAGRNRPPAAGAASKTQNPPEPDPAAAEDSYFDLFEFAPVGYFTVSARGIIQRANRAAGTLLAVGRDSLPKTPFTAWIGDEDRESFSGFDETVRERCGIYTCDLRLVRHDGKRLWATVQVVSNPAGGYLITATDSTARNEYEAALQRSASYSRNLLEASLDPLVTIDSHGKITDVNRATEKVTGQSRLTLIGSPFHLYFTEPTKALVAYLRAFADGFVTDYPLAIRHTSGKITEVMYNATVYRDESGNIDGIFAAARDITDLKRVEAALKQSERLHRTIFHTALEGFYLIDLHGRFIDVNEAYCRMVGYERSELLQRSVADLDVDEDADAVQRQVQEIIRSGTLRFERRHRCKDGRIIDVEASASYLPHENRLCTFIRDVTERKRVERLMQAGLQISNHALDHSLDEVLTKIVDEAELLTLSRIGFLHFVDADQKSLSLQAWSTNTTRLHCDAGGKGRHYPLEQAGIWADAIRERRPVVYNALAGLPGRKGYPPGHVTVERELVVPVFRNERIVAVFGVGNKEVPYADADTETLQHLANLSWDIIKRKAVEESLKAVEMKYSRLFKSMTDAYVCIDMTGRIIESNAVYQQMTGYGPDELATMTYRQLTPETWYALEAEVLQQQVLTRGYSDMYQKQYRRKDGTVIDVELKTYLLTDDSGEPIGMWAILGDITDRKREEKELQQAKEAAEAANCAKSEFLATMSHEIRTPLGTMLGNIELLEGTPLSATQKECLTDCKAASQVLLQVINDVLDFSKIEAGKLELSCEPFSITALGEQLSRMFATAARKKGLQFMVNLAEDLPPRLIGDRQRLMQIAANLLSNAIKFTPSGMVSLEISCDEPAAVDADGVLLQLVVSDTGIGIPSDKLNTIFDSFSRIEAFSTRTTGGTGLGLAICRQLLQLMGGSIVVTSTPGQGSTFTLELRLQRDRCRPTAPLPVPVTAVRTDLRDAPREILLADDDEMGRMAASKLLQRHGYRVTAVGNGAALLEALQRAHFDVVVTDISMPDLTGTEVARIIRAGERTDTDATIPIIAMTAHAFDKDRQRFLSSGFNGYTSKPVNIEDLCLLIESLCATSPPGLPPEN